MRRVLPLFAVLSLGFARVPLPKHDYGRGLLCGRIQTDNARCEERAMTDTSNRKPIRVSTDGTSGGYIMVSVDQLDKVRKLLQENDVPHWVDHNAISVDGRPAVAVINLGRRTDPRRVQELLDAAA
jgi:hypothetical protein